MLVGLVLLFAALTPASGQDFRPPSPDEAFNRLDEDGSGYLEPEELSSSRWGRMLSTDAPNGLSRDEFIETMERFRERFRRQGGREWRGGDRGRRGFGGNREQIDLEEDRSDGGNNEADSQADGPTTENGSQPAENTGEQRSTSGTTTKKATRPRITVDLQADLVPVDRDRDGQIGLYEWRRFSGRSLVEFQQLDRNSDGFVTPREIAAARPQTAPATAAVATASANGNTSGAQSSAGNDQAEDSADSNSADAPMETETADGDGPDERLAADAARFFRLLDKNEDGEITPDEWEGSRIRGMFTARQVDLSQPLPERDFTRYYVQFSEESE